jgi:hypothetical protein
LDSTIALEPSGLGAGTTIDLEQLLGLGSREKVFRFRGYWRFTPKHRLTFGGYRIDRSATGVIDEDIQWGDEIIEADATVDTTFDALSLDALYGYSMVHTSKIESGVSAGISSLDVSTSLFGTDNTTGETSGQGASVFLPLVVVGVYSNVTVKPKWFFEYYLNVFTGSYDRVGGNLFDFGISSSYFPTKHFGIGVGYYVYRIDIDVESSDYSGSIDYTNRGLNAYLTFAF